MFMLALVACVTPESFGEWYAEEVCAFVWDCYAADGVDPGVTEAECVAATSESYVVHGCEDIDPELARECREVVESLTCEEYFAGVLGESVCNQARLCL